MGKISILVCLNSRDNHRFDIEELTDSFRWNIYNNIRSEETSTAFL
jgi:hypothetical protein